MVPTLLCLSALLALPQPARPIKIAAPALAAVNLKPEVANFFSEHLAQRLRSEGLEVITQRELAALLGMERQRQLLGCADDGTSCMAELAAALDADGTLISDLALLDGLYLLNLKVLPPQGGAPLAEYSAQAAGDRLLLQAFEPAAQAIAGQLASRLGRTLRPRSVPGPAPASKAWIPVAAGGVLAGLGTVALVQGRAAHRALTTEDFLDRPGVAESRARAGAAYQTVGWVGVGVGAAALLTGGAMALWGSSSGPVAQAGLNPGGGWIGLTGALP